MLESFERGVVWKLNINHCSSCKGKSVALILWGYPADTDTIKEGLEKKEIVLGGCIITDHDPRWECNDCHHRWGERDYDE